jgi:hypothetical protein
LYSILIAFLCFLFFLGRSWELLFSLLYSATSYLSPLLFVAEHTVFYSHCACPIGCRPGHCFRGPVFPDS